jgi:predicted ferric reductase
MHLLIPSLALLVGLAEAFEAGRTRHGLIGFSFLLYDPVCAGACQGVFRKSLIYCTDAASFRKSGMTGMSSGGTSHGNFTLTPSPQCLAGSREFLTSVAWCVHTKCTTIKPWKLEKWWQNYCVGNFASDPPPSLSYGEALALVMSTPSYNCTKGRNMNDTCLPDEKIWRARFVAIDANQNVEVQHEQFALAVFLSGVGAPVLFSLLRFAPVSKRWATKLNAHFIYPSLFRSWRQTRVVSAVAGDPPTRGQALFISYMILLNVFLSAFTFKTFPEGFGFFNINGPDQIMTNLANRLGVLSFANFGILLLYSSRNNVLLWATDWQHSTYILLHRWVGRIAILQAILHSIIFLRDWIITNQLLHDQVLPYWWWGCIATIAASLLLPLSVPVIRQRQYELFLISHILLSILVLLGSWYHIYFKDMHQSGYEVWLYIAFAIWIYDRVVRVLRIVRYGVRTASITVIDQEYVRVDVEGMVATGHVYLYFLQMRFWENHPFSVASSTVQQDQLPSREGDSPVADVKSNNMRTTQTVARSLDQMGKPGIVFFLRTLDGATKALQAKSQVKVLIEGSYGKYEDLSEYPTLVCIAGGVGVTACLPYLRTHPGKAYLYWGSRSQSLVHSMKPLTQNFNTEITIGQRLDLMSILDGQVGDFAVVVSGPASMMDETREIVSTLSRRKRVKLVPESFTW